ncbi:MAG: SpaA isopeptide-forming pilin-related protein, partial [Lachnospiraceae bacterium]|nr:SpaA isopeptide-forming pilin-related protein [Lachnospiraceae bacterium]
DGAPEEGQTPVDKVIVFTYELDVNKVDGADQTNLANVTFNLYKKENDVKKYAQVVNGKLAGWTEAEEGATELKTDTDGLIKVAGLDDGTYYIHEINPLPGYNSIDDVEIVIAADTSNGQSGEGAVSELVKIDVTANDVAGVGNAEKGTATVTIANNKGANLPSTGGMGTTIFYVVGSILVLGAAILLITKKRMSAR